MDCDYDAIYLSPHLDDGPLSCGGQIHRRVVRGERILMVTIFAGDVPGKPLSDFARHVLSLMELAPDGAMAVRRQEDRQAARELGDGVEVAHWDFPEAIYRRSASGRELYGSPAELFGRPDTEDGGLVDELEARFRSLPAAARVLAPLGVGAHVDHQLVRRAAERLDGHDLGFYEEFPYVRQFRAVSKALGRKSAWRRETVALGPEDLSARIRAIAAYPSQVKPLFRGDERMAQRVRRYCRKVGGERIWRRR